MGAITYATFFVMPSIADAGPGGGAVVAGLRLLQVTSSGFSARYFEQPMGQAILAASITTVVAFVIGIGVSRPAMLRLGALLAQRESAAPDQRMKIDVEVEGLRAPARVASLALTLILLASAALMAVARYL